MEGTEKHHPEWKKPDTKECTLYDSNCRKVKIVDFSERLLQQLDFACLRHLEKVLPLSGKDLYETQDGEEVEGKMN